MSLPLVPTTELEAVNALLAGIGEAPLAQLDNTGLADASTARQRLHETSRRVQKRGWSWNTDYNLTLPLSPDGTVSIPSDTLKFNPTGDYDKSLLVTRGTKLYDAINNTNIFTTSVTADVIHFLAYETLPEAARQCIYLMAAVVFQGGFLGSDGLDKFVTRDAQVAWQDLVSEELEVADSNMLTDSYDMQIALNRDVGMGWW